MATTACNPRPALPGDARELKPASGRRYARARPPPPATLPDRALAQDGSAAQAA
ncbi:hypothetical protein GCM10009863_30530 [Streptomyces axinellae]|uniref:Uncharacterized protein n=1 Tax=Streptomyces axinellae TaxID=552788 RepID=A0ABN3Q5A6_9ACTN